MQISYLEGISSFLKCIHLMKRILSKTWEIQHQLKNKNTGTHLLSRSIDNNFSLCTGIGPRFLVDAPVTSLTSTLKCSLVSTASQYCRCKECILTGQSLNLVHCLLYKLLDCQHVYSGCYVYLISSTITPLRQILVPTE